MFSPRSVAWRAMGRLEQRRNEVPSAVMAELRAAAPHLPVGPTISVLMPVYDPPRRWLERAVASVREQTYPNWELCIADDRSTQPWVRDYLKGLAATDSRIKVDFRAANGHISEASNSALRLARGELVALLDNDDELSPLALLHVALHANRHPHHRVIYSDEDKIDTRGWRFGAYRKPGWNSDLLMSHNLISHLGIFDRQLMLDLGGFRKGLEGSQDHDLALRAAVAAHGQVGHIPFVLYHWRTVPTSTASAAAAKPYTSDAAVAAINDRLGPEGTAEKRSSTARFRGYRVIASPQDTSRVVIRVEDQTAAARDAALVSQDVIVFLNAGALGPPESSLVALQSHLGRPGIGAVGGSLLDRRGRIVDGGLWTGTTREGERRFAQPAYAGQAPRRGGPDSRAELGQTLSALSLGFLVIKRVLLEAVGGLDVTNFPHYADVDLCLRLDEVGYRCLWIPEITARSRRRLTRPEGAEFERLVRRHPRLLEPEVHVHPSTRNRGSYAARRFDDALGVAAAVHDTRSLTAEPQARIP